MKILIIICRILLIIVVVGWVFGYGPGTLGKIIVMYLGVSKTWAAVIESAMVGILGVASLFRVRRKHDNNG